MKDRLVDQSLITDISFSANDLKIIEKKFNIQHVSPQTLKFKEPEKQIPNPPILRTLNESQK